MIDVLFFVFLFIYIEIQWIVFFVSFVIWNKMKIKTKSEKEKKMYDKVWLLFYYRMIKWWIKIFFHYGFAFAINVPYLEIWPKKNEIIFFNIFIYFYSLYVSIWENSKKKLMQLIVDVSALALCSMTNCFD